MSSDFRWNVITAASESSGESSSPSPDAIWRGRSILPASGHWRTLLFLIGSGIVALLVDVPLSRAAFHEHRMRPLHGFLESMEPFGQPTAILMFAGGLWLCSPRLRSGLPRLLAASLGAGLAADVCKLFLARVRPRSFDWSGGPLATFHEFLPGLGRGSSHQSCPSSHTATALGFGLALSTMFPEGRWLFLTAAALVAAQRVECGAHFLSDTVWGATVGYAMSLLLFRPRFLGSWFDLQEARGWRRAESELAPVVLADSPAADPGTQRQAS